MLLNKKIAYDIFKTVKYQPEMRNRFIMSGEVESFRPILIVKEDAFLQFITISNMTILSHHLSERDQ